ncbi:hypothetical protein PFLUV_G00259700 [Perca fluviatilis]|uniref:Uncharacterized protein n=1 Tax=Perca fluviatilis TaxID=8168 RepID=A0A6A5DVY1_PERFL|nr:hypothetical protein PFLUV_G00259700 [Perca fluviatilis]
MESTRSEEPARAPGFKGLPFSIRARLAIQPRLKRLNMEDFVKLKITEWQPPELMDPFEGKYRLHLRVLLSPMLPAVFRMGQKTLRTDSTKAFIHLQPVRTDSRADQDIYPPPPGVLLSANQRSQRADPGPGHRGPSCGFWKCSCD